MSQAALGAWPVTLGGVPLTIIADPEQPGEEQSPGYSGTYFAQDVTRTLTKRDVPVTIGNRLSRGAGYVRRRDENDDGGYAWAENMITWQGNGAYPSGRRQSIEVTSTSGSYVIGSVQFNGHLWFLTTKDGIKVVPNSDPTQGVTTSPGAEAFNGSTSGFRSGYQGQCIHLFSDNNGVPAIYVGTTDGTDSRIYEYTVAGGWSEGAVLGFGARRMASCFWMGVDGAGAERLHLQVSDSVVRHCIQGSDPLLAASYVTPITVGNAAHDITGLTAFPQHLVPVKRNGIHLVNELRSANATPYWEEQGQILGLTASMTWGKYVVACRGWGLDLYDTSVEGRQQRDPMEAGFGTYAQDGTPINGYYTALTSHDGDLVAALYNPANKTTYIGRARTREDAQEPGPGPLVWYWAEQVIEPVSDVGQQVWHMRVASPSATAGPPVSAHTAYLWMASMQADGSSPIRLHFAPLPTGGGPISMRLSGASFEVNPTARLYLTAQDWDDPLAEKPVRVYDQVGQKVTSTSTIELKARADGDPTTITNQATWTSVGTAQADDARLVPASELKGKSIMHQVVLTTPSPYTSPPVFQSLSARAKVIRETFKVIYLNVLLERDYELANGAPDIRDPDVSFDTVAALQDQGLVTYVDEDRTSRSVYVEQGVRFGRTHLGGNHWRTVMRVELSVVAA